MRSIGLRTAVSLLLFALCAFTHAPAHASFPDCNDVGYLAKFDVRLGSEPGYLCVESEHVPVTSSAGTTHIRIIQHLLADWATRPGAMRAFKQGVTSSVVAMRSLGDFALSDVTILLVDGYAPGRPKERFGDIAAWTSTVPGEECRITLWLLGSGATADYGAAVVAHELFHCVQRSNLSSAQMGSGAAAGAAGGGSWWLEGSADWFSTVAVPAPAYMRDRVTAFDGDSPRVALNAMAYDAYVFFAWLGGAHRPASVLPFLRSMASSASASAQRTAMTAALPAEQWLRFAEDYLDQDIRDGQGTSLGSTPQRGDPYTWDATRTQRIELPAFVLARADLTVRCGRWRFEPSPPRFHAARPADGTDWGPLPASLDAMDGASREFRFAGMAASAGDVPLQVVGTREAACSDCGGTREVDQCLVGTWELTSHGAEQWMSQHGSPARLTGIRRTNNVMTLLDDGTFSTGAARVAAEVEGVDNIRATARLAGQTSGRWSAAGGRFNVCPDVRTLHGNVTVIVHGHPITVPVNPARQADSSQPYVCDGSSLRVTTPMAGSSITSVYTRVSGPR